MFESEGTYDPPENAEIEAKLRTICTDDIFNGFITLNEIAIAVKSMKAGKSAGNDDLTAEFYCFSLPNIVPVLSYLFNIIYS